MTAYEKLSCDMAELDARILGECLSMDKALRGILRRFWTCQIIKCECADAIKSNTELLDCLPGKK